MYYFISVFVDNIYFLVYDIDKLREAKHHTKGAESMSKKIYVEKTDLQKKLAEISAAQSRNGVFHNVTVKPYKGQYHPAEIAAGVEYVVIVIG